MKKLKDEIKFWLAVLLTYLISGLEWLVTKMKPVGNFLLKWNEFITIPLGWYLVKWSEPIITSEYPTSTRYDVGFYYDVVYSIGAFFILHGVAWILFKINWIVIEKHLDVNLEKDFGNLEPLQRIKIAIWLSQSYLYAVILTFLAVSLAG